jgi:hypothetical protein
MIIEHYFEKVKRGEIKKEHFLYKIRLTAGGKIY